MATQHVDSSAQIDLNDSLSLKSHMGESVELTIPRLEKLFAQAELSLDSQNKELVSQDFDRKSPELATQFLSRFGLQTPQDVITFLKSPEGEEMLAMINEELAELAAINDHIQQDALEHQLFEKRAVAFLLLGLLHRREAQADHLNIHLQQDIEQHQKEHREANEALAKASEMATKYENEPGENYEVYSKASHELEKSLQSKLQDAEKLEEKLGKMVELFERIESKYAGYNAHMDSVHEDIAKLPDNLNHTPEQMSVNLAKLTEQMSKEATEISALLATGDPADKLTAQELTKTRNERQKEAASLQDKLSVREGSIKTIQTTIKKVTQQINADAEEIGKLLETGDTKDERRARELMEKCNERNLEIATLQDLVSVLKGDKTLCKEDGTPATSFSDADLILPKGNKIVEKDGKYLLLRANQTLDDMSKDDQNEAAKKFLQLKPEMMGVNKLVKHNHSLEKIEYVAQKEPLDKENHRMQKDILLLANQLKHMQAAANTEALLKQPQTSPTVKMSPLSSKLTPMATPTLAPNQQCFSDSYKHMLQLMRNNPSVTSINWLKTSLATDKTGLLTKVNGLRPGMPIPPETMKLLLRGHAWENNNNLANTTPESTAPTPLPMTPRPNGPMSR